MIDRPEAAYDYSFYTIIPDGWEYDQTKSSKKYPYIVDSGTTLNYLPPSMSHFFQPVPSSLKCTASNSMFP